VSAAPAPGLPAALDEPELFGWNRRPGILRPTLDRPACDDRCAGSRIDAGEDEMGSNRGLPHPRLLAAGLVAGALVAVVMVVAAACNQPVATPTPKTGVLGRVTASPTCPVERPGESPCIRTVAGAVILALDSNGREVARATSDAAGAYFLPLAPGTYRVVPQPVEGLMGTAAEQPVTVTSGAPVQLDFDYDTGIR
jgi:hypothetical protein